MQSTGFSNKALDCALLMPETAIVKGTKQKVMRCCLDSRHRKYFVEMEMCGTVACPFFKPVGKAETIRKEKGRDVWFMEMPDRIKELQMSPEKYQDCYGGLHSEKRAKGKSKRVRGMAHNSDPAGAEDNEG